MVNISKITKKRLGELLVAEGLITNDQVKEALDEQKKLGSLLGETLIKLRYVSEFDIAAAIAAQFGLPYIDAGNYNLEKEIFELVPVEFMKKNELVPLDRIGNIITIAVCGPLSEKVFDELEKITGCEAYLFVSTSSQVHKVIDGFVSSEKK